MADVIMGAIRTRTGYNRTTGFFEYYDVEFFVDGNRHHFSMSPEGFTAEKAEEEVRRRAQEIVKAQDKKIKLG